MSEDGRKQQAKLKELSHIAEKLGCTLPQLAIGEGRHAKVNKNVSNSQIQCFSFCFLIPYITIPIVKTSYIPNL